MDKPISVIIPVHNAPKELKACIASLEATARGIYELILVDNASSPATRRYIASIKSAKKIRNSSNLGFAKAVNQGIKKASGRYVAIVNSDIVFFPGGLQGLAACLDMNPSAGAVGPFTNRTSGIQIMDIRNRKPLHPGKLKIYSQALRLKFADLSQEVHRLTGFCLMLRRQACESVGLLDERFGIGCYEDLDYCLRLRQAGWKLRVARDVLVWHREHSSFKSRGDLHALVLKNREVFVDKWCRKALEFLDEIDSNLKTPAPRFRRRKRRLCRKR